MPTLILLPGMDGTGLLFEDLQKILEQTLEVVIVSYPLQQPMDYDALLPVVRAYLPDHKPYVLLAESFSGPLAIKIAASLSPNLRGLIFSASFVCNPRPLLRAFGFLLHRSLIAVIPLAWYVYFLLGPFATKVLRGKIAKVIAMVAPEVLRTRALAVLKADEREALSHLRVPMLYLKATADRTVPAQAYDQIKQCAPHCRLEDLPAPHFLLQAVPQKAAERIFAFVQNCAKKEAACAAGSGEGLRCQTSQSG